MSARFDVRRLSGESDIVEVHVESTLDTLKEQVEARFEVGKCRLLSPAGEAAQNRERAVTRFRFWSLLGPLYVLYGDLAHFISYLQISLARSLVWP